jgi:hypothetical protein
MNYYDPWGHVFRIVINRLLFFVFLAMTCAALLWWWVLHRYFGYTWIVALSSALPLAQGEGGKHWQVIFWLTVTSSTLATSTLFALLIGRNRLRRGDRHRRGARIVDADHDEP